MTNVARLIRPRDRADVDPRVSRSRDAVLEATAAIMLEEGWEAVTPVRVAERSGVGRTTIYRHWPDRSALLHDTLLRIGVRDEHRLTGDLREDLVTLVDATRQALASDQTRRLLAVAIERAVCAPVPDFAALLQEMIRRHTEIMRAVLTEAARTGALRADLDVEEAIVTLEAPLVYRAMAAGMRNTRALVERAVDDFLEFNR